MPELPDITVYIEAIEKRIMAQRVEGARVNGPFVLRTFEPPLKTVEGKTVRALRRVGKRIAIGLEEELWLVVHLMRNRVEVLYVAQLHRVDFIK